MGRVNLEELSEVWGYCFNCFTTHPEYVCPDCVTEEELRDLENDEMLTEKDVDQNSLFFCDRCKKRME